MNTVTTEMPCYQSHKKVWALKIHAVTQVGRVMIHPADEGFAPFEAPEGWFDRFKGDLTDAGYFVRYEDGYTSWSPTEAFESGHTRISS